MTVGDGACVGGEHGFPCRAGESGGHRWLSGRGKPANKRTAPGYLVECATVHGWTAAINALDTAYPGRITPTTLTNIN